MLALLFTDALALALLIYSIHIASTDLVISITLVFLTLLFITVAYNINSKE
jgi:hypothetical protein